VIIIELKISRNRIKVLRYRVKYFKLLYYSESRYLRFIEETGVYSIYIVEPEIPRVLRATYEDHGYYISTLTLDYLIG